MAKTTQKKYQYKTKAIQLPTAHASTCGARRRRNWTKKF